MIGPGSSFGASSYATSRCGYLRPNDSCRSQPVGPSGKFRNRKNGPPVPGKNPQGTLQFCADNPLGKCQSVCAEFSVLFSRPNGRAAAAAL